MEAILSDICNENLQANDRVLVAVEDLMRVHPGRTTLEVVHHLKSAIRAIAREEINANENVAMTDAIRAIADEVVKAHERERCHHSGVTIEAIAQALIYKHEREGHKPAPTAACGPFYVQGGAAGTATPKPAPDPAEEAWRLDERVGIVTIYRGAERNCLSGISTDPDCVFVARGAWNSECKEWIILPEDLAMAHRCYAALTGHRAATEAGKKREERLHLALREAAALAAQGLVPIPATIARWRAELDKED